MEVFEFITPLSGPIFLPNERQEQSYEGAGTNSEHHTDKDGHQLSPPVNRGGVLIVDDILSWFVEKVWVDIQY